MSEFCSDTQAIQEMMLQTVFSLTPNETLTVDGNATYLKSLFNLMSCHAFLTSNRLVFCSKKGVGLASALFGPIGGVIALARKPIKITFQVAISDIKSVTKVKHGFGSMYQLETVTENQYKIQFINPDRWINNLRELGIKCIV